MRPLDNVLPKLEGVKAHGGWWEARCPSHEDGHASLSVSVGKDDRVLMFCHAGCDKLAVLEHLQLGWDDLFPTREQADTVVAEYEYRDEAGRLLFVVERRAGKRFVQRHPTAAGDWAWNLNGVKRVLYRLPKVLAAKRQRHVFLVEGEKDVHTLEGLGFVATCNSGGAGKWRKEYTEQLAGAKAVVVLPDNDDPGNDHAIKLMSELRGKVQSLQVVSLPGLPPKGDVTDWVAAGGTAAQLKQLVMAARQAFLPKPGWVRAASSYTQQGVDWLWFPRIPRGCVTVLAGVQGNSKSFLTLAIAASLSHGSPLPDGGFAQNNSLGARDPVDTLLITYEDDLERTVIPRLWDLGADMDRVHLVDHRSEDGTRSYFRAQDIPLLHEALAENTNIGLVVVDPAAALQVGGAPGSENSEADVRGVIEPLTALAARWNVAVLAVKHLNKDVASKAALFRVGGSSAWTAVPRSVLLCGTSADDPTLRGLAHIKSNLGPRAGTVQYRLGAGGFGWLAGRSDLDVAQLLKAPQ